MHRAEIGNRSRTLVHLNAGFAKRGDGDIAERDDLRVRGTERIVEPRGDPVFAKALSPRRGQIELPRFGGPRVGA